MRVANFAELNTYNYSYDVVKESLEAVKQLNRSSSQPSKSAVDNNRDTVVENPQLTAAVH